MKLDILRTGLALFALTLAGSGEAAPFVLRMLACAQLATTTEGALDLRSAVRSFVAWADDAELHRREVRAVQRLRDTAAQAAGDFLLYGEADTFGDALSAAVRRYTDMVG
jgi:ribosomal protein L17